MSNSRQNEDFEYQETNNNNNMNNISDDTTFSCSNIEEYQSGMSQYVQLTDTMNYLKGEIKKKKFECDRIEPHLLNFMSVYNLTKNNINDGGCIKREHEEKPKQLSLGYLEKLLQVWFNQPGKNTQEAAELMQFIKSHREVSVRDYLSRQYA